MARDPGEQGRKYYDAGATLGWGRDMSTEILSRMQEGEIFTLTDDEGRPFSRILMDDRENLRERRLDRPLTPLQRFVGRLLGIPMDSVSEAGNG